MLADASNLLVTLLFDLYLTLLMVRFILQWLTVDYNNPISQFTVKLTDPILKPLHKLIPNWRRIDVGILLVLVVFAMLKNALLIWSQYEALPYPAGLMVYALGNLLALLSNLLFYTLLIRVILSWVSPGNYNPAIAIIYRVTEPFLVLARRIVPIIAGIDLSPILVFIVLKLLDIVVIERLLAIGKALAVAG